MGVPAFNRWINEQSDKAKVPFIFNNVSTESATGDDKEVVLMIDGNHSLHQALGALNARPETVGNRAEAEVEFSKELFLHLNEIAGRFNSPGTIMFAVDGTPPNAKIAQQAERRKGGDAKTVPAYIDSDELTPYTPFMRTVVHDTILSWIGTRPESNIIYSPYSSPGEGEHKILSLLRGERVEEYPFDIPLDSVVIIYGGDSDISIAGILNDPAPRDVYLFIPKDHSRRDSRDRFVSFTLLREWFLSKWSNSEVNERDTLLTIIVHLAFLGNDFMPTSPFATDMDTYIKYTQEDFRTNGACVNETSDGLDFGSFDEVTKYYAFIDRMAENEAGLRKAELRGYNANDYMALNAMISNSELFIQDHRNFLAFNTKDIGLTSTEITQSVMEVSQQYMEMAIWMVYYYTRPLEIVPKDWCYKHYAAPIFQIMAESLNEFKSLTDDIETGVVRPYEHLIMVMPHALLLESLDRKFHPLLEKDGLLGYLWPVRSSLKLFKIIRTGKAQRYRHKIRIPDMDADLITSYVRGFVSRMSNSDIYEIDQIYRLTGDYVSSRVD